MRKLAFLIFWAVLPAFAAHNLFAGAFPYSGDMTAGVNGADDKWDSYIDLMLPIAGNESSFLFISPRASMTGEEVLSSHSSEMNFGAGYRYYSERYFKKGAIYGINAYYDARKTSLGNNYRQAGIGLEFLSKRADFRANAYIPFGNNDYFLGKSYNVFENNNIAATHYYEAAMRGFDGEIGWNMPVPEIIGELRLFAGYYNFASDKVAKRYHGVKGRAEYKPVSIFSIYGSVYRYDHLTGSEWQAGASVNIPLNFIKLLQGKNPFGSLLKLIKVRTQSVKDRMGIMVQRDMHIRAYGEGRRRFDDIVSDEDGHPYHFTVVSPEGTGDGTFKNPASLAAGAGINKAVTGKNAVMLLLGGNYALGEPLDFGGHAANNVLVTGPQEMEARGVDLSMITSGNPVISVSGAITAFRVDSSGTETFSITSIEFEGSSKTGTGLEIVNNKNSFYIGNNRFSNFEKGFSVESSTGGVYAYNNIISGNATGAELAGKNIFFEQNVISKNDREGILVRSGGGVYIQANRFEENGYGINAVNSSGTVIYLNELRNNSFNAVNIINSEASAINDNLSESNLQSGIFLSGGTGNEIIGNRLLGNSGNGIAVENSSSTIIADNTAENNTLNGIYASGNSFLLAEVNTINSNKENGIYASGESGIILYDNAVSSNTRSGIYIYAADDADIRKNNLKANEVNGLYVSNLKGGYFDGNIIENSGNDGMRFENSGNFSVSGSTASRSASNGMSFQNVSDVIVYNNRLRENYSDGIFIDSGTRVEVLGNRIAGSGANGIYADGISSSTVRANYFEENGVRGGQFANVKETAVENNFFVGNASEGASFQNIGGSRLEGNTAEANLSDGMSFENASDTVITDNIVDKNKGDAFRFISGSGVLFSGNSIYENEKTGINIESGSAVISSGNYIQNNAEGIRAVNAPDFAAVNNTVEGNTGGGIYISGVSGAHIYRNRVFENGGYGGIYGENLTGQNVIERNTVSSNTSAGITVINADGALLDFNTVAGNAGLGGIYVENFNNGRLTNNSAYYNSESAMTIKGSSNLYAYNNGLYYTDTGHGLTIADSAGITVNTNFFQRFGVSGRYGLNLKGNVTFDGAASGNNNFINSASYGGDAAPVLNYETNVKNKDNFY
ncbi:MAG: right-handed parallel beta-helix repeat-containing protein [Endomicrobium sp.]|jgi:parallel beta-helix repeat protein|nr:right-handed parallel beta-helix repeat-containing protein [Endomicrobium sp.]